MKKDSNGYILLSFNIVNKQYVLSFFDSAEAFPTDVLSNIGKQSITSHANDGGSGIVLMSTFDILKQSLASLMIEEYPENNSLCTKKVAVIFDEKNQYTLLTYRNEEEISLIEKNATLKVIKKS